MMQGRQRCVGGAIPVAYHTDFNRKAREMLEAANIALIAAKKHDANALGDAGERIDVACDECHEKYQLLEGDPENIHKVLGTYKMTAAEKSAKAQAPAAPRQ
jgi:fructose-1,6-bisphosphatase